MIYLSHNKMSLIINDYNPYALSTKKEESKLNYSFRKYYSKYINEPMEEYMLLPNRIYTCTVVRMRRHSSR